MGQVLNVGDLIYAVVTDHRTGGVRVENATVVTAGKVYVTTSHTSEGFGYKVKHKREDVFTNDRDALRAYRDKTVQLLLIMGRALSKGHMTLESIDAQLELGGE